MEEEKLIVENYITNNPIMDILYPKIMSYIPVKENNIYKTVITDLRIRHIEKIQLKLHLPEIKGKGSVSYLKYYPFHLLKYFEIYYKNNSNDDEEKLLQRIDSEEIIMCLLSSPDYKKYLNYCSGKNDYLCIEKTGTYKDCIIFPSREILIPIEMLLGPFNIFPETVLIFKFELNSIKDIISYDITYFNNSLSDLLINFEKTDLNIKLQFTNTIIDENEIYTKPIHFIRRKTSIGKNKVKYLVSKNFNNCLGVSFYVKSEIFTSNNRFIINMGVKTKEKILINKWLKSILKDLIIITNKNLLLDEEKEFLGFDKKAVFIEVKNNIVNLPDDTKCKVFIELVPEECKIYYHSNILSFTRRFKKNNILNVSTLFQYIKGICYLDDNMKIEYFIDDIIHKIDIGVVSIPVDVWNDVNNTSTGDLRSKYSKNKDFYFNNKFILGTDFLSKDKGYNNISLTAGRDILENYTIETKPTYKVDIYKTIEFDKNMYPSISMFRTCSYTHKFITCDKDINFNNFVCKIDWNTYPEYHPLDLYIKHPHIIIYELVCIYYDEKTKNINIKEVY